eukprot:EG_transcript_39210
MVTANRWKWYKWPFPFPSDAVALDAAEDKQLSCNEEWGRFVMCKSMRNRARLLYWEGNMSGECRGLFQQYMKCWRCADKETEQEIYRSRRRPVPVDRHPWTFKAEYLALLEAQGRRAPPQPQ